VVSDAQRTGCSFLLWPHRKGLKRAGPLRYSERGRRRLGESSKNRRDLPAFSCWLPPTIHATAAVTNALLTVNFELQTGNGKSQTVSNWFESSRNQTTTTGSALARPMPDSFPPRRATSSIFTNPNGCTCHHHLPARVVAHNEQSHDTPVIVSSLPMAGLART